MANTLSWQNLNTIFTSTGPGYLRGKIEEIVFEAHPFLYLIKDRGGIEDYKIPGVKLVLPVRIGRNSSVANRGTREDVPINQNETATTAEFPWGSITGAIPFADEDLHDNMGPAQLVPLVETAIDQAIDTVNDVVSLNILQQTSGDGAFQIYGLKDGVADGTLIHPGNYGGLTPANYPGWAANMVDGSTLANLISNLNHGWNSATFGSNKPDFTLTTQTGEELYRDAMDANLRYTDFGTGDATFNAVTFRGKPLMFDRQVTSITATPAGGGAAQTWSGTLDTASTNRFYQLRTANWKWIFDEAWNLENSIEKEWRFPVNSFSRIKLLAVRCQMVTTQRRYQSCVVNVPSS